MIQPADPRPAGATDSPLLDSFGRRIDYLRLAVTERCNLRCRYCMPAEGIPLAARDEVLRIEDMLELCSTLVRAGVRKVRLTGGEPLVRAGVMDLVEGLAKLDPSLRLGLTTNGVLVERHLDRLLACGLRHVNLSLDSMRRATFARITRRDGFQRVQSALRRLLEAPVQLKVNVVVIPGLNDGELGDFLELARSHDLTVRFIEPMPFDGASPEQLQRFDGDSILARLREVVPFRPDPEREGVADIYRVPGYRGRVGIIRGQSRSFCAGCDRLRLDACGRLRTCLYGPPVADLGSLLRAGANSGEITSVLRAAIADRASDGIQAERRNDGSRRSSMASIGG